MSCTLVCRSFTTDVLWHKGRAAHAAWRVLPCQWSRWATSTSILPLSKGRVSSGVPTFFFCIEPDVAWLAMSVLLVPFTLTVVDSFHRFHCSHRPSRIKTLYYSLV